MLPDTTGKQFRNLITAIVEFNGTDIAILITHLHTKQGQEQQLVKVLEESKKYEFAILMGDFNTNRDNPLIDSFLSETDFIDAFAATKDHEADSSKIDWIFTKGFNVHSSIKEPIGISDHPYYQVTLSLKK